MFLVIGGAGYIGSRLVKELVKKEEVVVLDNLSASYQEAVDSGAVFVKGDLGNEEDLQMIFRSYPIKAVLHMAANSRFGNSEQEPLTYYENNVSSTITLLKVMLEYKVKNLIFSMEETTSEIPLTPSERSKYMVEQILVDFSNAYGLRYQNVRYVQQAKADESISQFEDDQVNHLTAAHLQALEALLVSETV